MKRWILILAGLALALAASAQETILDRLKAANTFDTMQLSFVQTRHSALLTKDLVSEGRMVEKDFTATTLEGEDLTVKLVPVRRDLKSLFREIIVHADKQSLQIRSALLITPDGDWTQLAFKDLVVNQPVDAKLFEKE